MKVRNSEQGRRPSPPCPCLGPSLFLAEFGLSFPVAVAFNHDNLGVVGEAIDQRDRAGGVGKDGVPVLERQVRRHEQGAVFIAAADDLEEEVGGVGIVGEVANLVDGEEGGPRAVAEAPLKGAGGLLAIEIEQQVRGRDEARAVAGQDDLMDDVLGEHRFAEALGADQEDILGAGKEVEGEDAVEGGAVGQFQSQSAMGLKRPRRAAVSRRSILRRCRSSSSAVTRCSRRTVEFQRWRVARARMSLRSSAVRSNPRRRRSLVKVVGTSGEGIVALQAMGPDIEVADAGPVG